MKLAANELKLLCLTGAVVVIGLTYLLGKPKFAEWKTFYEQRTELEERLETAEQLLESRPEMEARLEIFRNGLPVFQPNQRAGSELLLDLERMARTHGITLQSRKVEEEQQTGDLFELSISCRWEGTLEALVRFLYAQQSLGPVSDVKDLTISPVSSRNTPTDRLNGNFTIDYAYRRNETNGSQPAPMDDTP